MQTTRAVNISNGTIFRILFFVGLALALFAIREVLVTVFVALVLAAALDPTISRLERRGMPRGTAMIAILILTVGAAALLAKLVVPVVVQEAEQFGQALFAFYQEGVAALKESPNPQVRATVTRMLEGSPEGITEASEAFFGGLLSVFGGAFGLIGVVVLTVYGAVYQRDLLRMLLALAPGPMREGNARTARRIRQRLGQWLRGQVLLGAIIFALTWIGLSLLQVKFALVLALIAGVTEWIPIVGPMLGAIPAILVAVSQYPMLGVWVLLLYIVVQQLENYLIVPRVMSHATGLNPLIVIVAILIGAKLAGILGIFLAVPMAIIGSTWLEDVLEQRAKREAALAAVSAITGDSTTAVAAAESAIADVEAAATLNPPLGPPRAAGAGRD
jgi:predicted PurR-regulated permease PerM